jgi:LPS export ABC transporter permease LptF/LPS export ABC transporter permease LptG
MRILTRYILAEMVTPTFLGLGFYTFILLMRQLFDLAEMIIKRSLPAPVVLKLLALALPNILVLTIPMALLFGLLIAIGRLSSDSEIIAIRAAGVDTATIYRPVFYFSFALFIVNLTLMNVLVPAGNSAWVDLKARIFASTIEREIKPRVFYDEYENRVIYINDLNPAQGLWKGVFISDSTDPERQQIIVAESGKLAYQPKTNQAWVTLQNATTHVFSPRKQERYDLSANASQRFLMPDRFSQAPTRASRSLREMSLAQLLEELPHAKKRDPIDYRLTLVEIHKKFSIPFACLAFGIVGLPLGITNRRGGKSSGFSLSIAIILLYYILISNGEDLARTGRLPAVLAMWLPNLVLVAIGIFLLRRLGADAGRGSSATLFDRITHRLAERRERRRGEAADSVDDSVLSRLDIAFPNTLDRYVLREFFKVMFLVLISATMLIVVVDYLTDTAGSAAENHVATQTVIAYYRYFVLHSLDLTLPISVLLATLITFGVFSKNNEVTAMKAHGISLYRLAVPVLIVATVVSVLSYFLLDFVLPYANERAAKLKNIIKGRETRRAFSVQQRQWIFGKGRYLFNFLSYDKSTQTLSQVQVFEFDPVSFHLTRRVWADEARFDGTGWVFSNGWIRSFGDDGTSSYSPIYTPIRLHYPERPQYFALEAKAPNQMTFRELNRYIRDLRKSGYESDELLVQLYQKTAWPFISLVMASIALPFSFKIGKRGALYGVGIALFLTFVYWMLYGIFTKFGEVGNLPAILSAWSANILFLLAAMYMFVRVET